MENKKVLFEQEKANALNYINFERFISFLYMNAYEYVGFYNGKETTLREEVKEVLRLSHVAYVESSVENVGFYQSFKAYRMVEEDNHKAKSQNLYEKAAKKLIFLNSKCKEMTNGRGFIERKINLRDKKEVVSLIEGFEWTIAHFEILR